MFSVTQHLKEEYKTTFKGARLPENKINVFKIEDKQGSIGLFGSIKMFEEMRDALTEYIDTHKHLEELQTGIPCHICGGHREINCENCSWCNGTGVEEF